RLGAGGGFRPSVLLEGARGGTALRDLRFLAVQDPAEGGDLMAEADRHARIHLAARHRLRDVGNHAVDRFLTDEFLGCDQHGAGLPALYQFKCARLDLDAHCSPAVRLTSSTNTSPSILPRSRMRSISRPSRICCRSAP